MANIKIDVDALTKAIRDEGERAKDRLEAIVKECVTEVGVAASAVKTLPPSAVDLIATADVCLVAEVDTRERYVSGGDCRLQVTIDIDGGFRVCMASFDHAQRPALAEGRYRAIFVLVPIEKR